MEAHRGAAAALRNLMAATRTPLWRRDQLRRTPTEGTQGVAGLLAWHFCEWDRMRGGVLRRTYSWCQLVLRVFHALCVIPCCASGVGFGGAWRRALA